MLLPDGSTLTLPDTEHLRVQLRFTESATFHFLHGGVIHGLLCRHLGHDLPKGLVPFAPESGKITFEAGDPYVFGLTAVGDARGVGPALEAELRRAGGRRGRRGRTLDGNFRVESCRSVAPVELDTVYERARALAQRRSVELRFLSPLRLDRAPEDRQPGQAFLNAECFPPELVLQRLWQRWRFLTTSTYPKYDEMPAMSSGLTADPHHLTWMDMPVRGRNGKAGRPKGITLGGVVGEVSLEGLTADWCLLLAAMQPYHLGKSVFYGCGRYRLPEVSSLEDEPFLPASRGLHRSLKPSIEALLSDCSFAYRRGYSGQNTTQVMRRAFDDGYRHMLDANLGTLLTNLGEARILARLQALFPFEPWASVVPPLGSATFQKSFAPLVAALFLSELGEEILGPDYRLVRLEDDFVILGRDPSLRDQPNLRCAV